MKNFNEFILENEILYGTKKFREVSTLIKKEFPSITFTHKDNIGLRYSYSYANTKENSFDLPDQYYKDVRYKTLNFKNVDALDLVSFLKKHKITTIIPSITSSYIYLIDDNSTRILRKAEKSHKYYVKKDNKAKEEKARQQKEEDESYQIYTEKLYPKLRKIPLFKFFNIPGVGCIRLGGVYSSGVTVFSMGSLKQYSGNNKKDLEVLEKIIDFMYNHSDIRGKLQGSKFGI